MDFGMVLKSKLEPKSTKNRSKTVSKLRCKFECIFEGSWTPVGPILEARMGPRWGQVGAKNEEEGASGGKEQEKREEQTDLQGFAEFERHLGPGHEKKPGDEALRTNGGKASQGC